MAYAPQVAKTVVLHIGAMKSGTSFIQSVLDAHRGVLREHDILYACRRWRGQVLAVRELTENGGRRQPPLPTDGYWGRMVEEINAFPGTAIVSMEFLAPRRVQKIQIIQEAFAGADLQVVLTARDLARSIPAMWTESVQNRGVRTWEEFLGAVRHPEEGRRPSRWFWNHQDIAAISERWSTAVGRDHFTLVTVPPKGAPPSLLWDRFAQAAGIPDGLCTPADVRSNPGLDAASALVLRALNERLEEAGLERWQYERLVKGLLAKRGLVRRGRESVPLGLDERWVRRRSREDLDALRTLDLRVIGDLGELEARPVPGVHTRKVSSEQQLDAALDGLAFLVQNLRAGVAPGPGDLPGGEEGSPPVDTAEDEHDDALLGESSEDDEERAGTAQGLRR